MKKISYRSKETEKKLPLSGEVINIGSHQSSRENENGGSFGIIFPGSESTHKFPDPETTVSEYIKVISDFVDMADNLDDEELVAEADFIDFIIQKFAIAQQISVSEEEKYIEYIYKIYNSDIQNSIDKIKNLTLKYSAKVNNLVLSGVDSESAKNQAFSTELLMEKI